MNTIFEKAWAKLNISLDVTSRRDDGYHDMTMVMQTVSLHDDVVIQFNDSGHISASCNLPFIPKDIRNLAVRAAVCYMRAIGSQGTGMLITMKKNIPVGAGMGGGSSDAAAVLRALNRRYGALSPDELEVLSAEVGSDVPFCVRGGTALATGRGEKLKSLPDIPDCEFVICKPEFSISTPELFRKLDRCSTRCHPDTEGILDGLQKGDLLQISRRLYNVFEDIDDRRLRVVGEIKGRLLDYGALGAIMTGTGSAVFGIFPKGAVPDILISGLREDYGFCEKAVRIGRLN